MVNKIKLIIFDYDGVIVDSFPTIHKAYQSVCKKLGKRCPSKFSDFRKIYGMSLKDLYNNLGFLTEEERKKVRELSDEEILKQEPKFFHKIDEVIKVLGKEYKLILVSFNSQKEIERKLGTLGVKEHFDKVIGSNPSEFIKKSDMLKKLISDSRLNPEEIILIGDRINDYYDAKEAGINNILLVDYGWGYDLKKIPEHKQNVVIKAPWDIIKAVESFNKG